MRRNYMIAAGLLLAACTSAYAGTAGQVVFVSGQAKLGGELAKLNDSVQEGDELSTAENSYIYVKTVDQGFLILRPNTRARVTQYHIDSKDAANTRVKLELLSGVARAISGQGVKLARQNFRFNTPVAAIGVRGTDFVVFANEQTTRVAVMAGGVVMSGYSGSCRADGAGPCEGGGSRELFAGQVDTLLQVLRGEAAPRLLKNRALLPDQAERPRSDEPPVKESGGMAMPAVNLDPVRGAAVPGLTAGSGSGKPTGPSLPSVLPPPSKGGGLDAEALPSAPEVFWGRWQTIASLPIDSSSSDGKKVENSSFVGPYKITRLSPSELLMPTEGTAAFKLAGGEAVMQRSTGSEVAKIDSGQLQVNFVDRTFTTGLMVSEGKDKVNVLGSGSIDNKGKMLNGAGSQTVIQGYLGGRGATEAAYIFKNETVPGISVVGATSWTK